MNSPLREKELGERLYELACADSNVAYSAREMLNRVEQSLKDVQDALGDGGAMYPQNVPKAAARLAE